MVVDVVIHFPDGVLGAVLVWKGKTFKRSLPGVGSVKSQQIIAEWVHDKARILRDEVSRGVGEADGAVTGGEHSTPVTTAAGNRSRCGDVSWKRVADGITLSFKRAKIKKLVLDDASPRSGTELLELDGSLIGANGIEVV